MGGSKHPEKTLVKYFVVLFEGNLSLFLEIPYLLKQKPGGMEFQNKGIYQTERVQQRDCQVALWEMYAVVFGELDPF